MKSAGDGKNASLRSMGQARWERLGQETQTMGPGKVANKLWTADMHGKAQQHTSTEARASPMGDGSREHCTGSTYARRMGSWKGKASSFSKKNARSNCSPVTYWRGITEGNTGCVFLMGKSLFCNFHVYGVCMYMHVFMCKGTHVCACGASGSCWKSSSITLLHLRRQGLFSQTQSSPTWLVSSQPARGVNPVFVFQGWHYRWVFPCPGILCVLRIWTLVPTLVWQVL